MEITVLYVEGCPNLALARARVAEAIRVAGAVKTRLCPPCSPAEVAAALADTLEAVAACGAGRRIVALWSEPGPWLPPGMVVVAQRGRTLGERLGCAWADAGGPGLQIGSDTPRSRRATSTTRWRCSQGRPWADASGRCWGRLLTAGGGPSGCRCATPAPSSPASQ